MTIVFDIYEQELFGDIQFRVMRRDFRRFLELAQVDFDMEQHAIDAVFADARRQKYDAKIHVHHLDRQSNGRRHIEKIHYSKVKLPLKPGELQ